jgi:hypothetical protein
VQQDGGVCRCLEAGTEDYLTELCAARQLVISAAGQIVVERVATDAREWQWNDEIAGIGLTPQLDLRVRDLPRQLSARPAPMRCEGHWT